MTTPGVDAARERLTELGYEVLVFHTSGSGGRTLESLAEQGLFAGILDLTLSERQVRLHNPSITVIRTTAAECAELGRGVAAKLRAATGPTAVCLPRRGLCTLGGPGAPYHDPHADDALFTALRDGLRGSATELLEFDTHINDPAFGRAASEELHRMITAHRATAGEGRAA
ncbi:Tm-1-like ATP-binding domain-containing protein [Streptomyces sp. NPDC002870]|uniref:Tm-1-like ATP-binding domain-containing protein n=1 Tax=Streptomyces sp. NPDC002870 TaxID=3364666 RepID=UPI00367A2392